MQPEAPVETTMTPENTCQRCLRELRVISAHEHKTYRCEKCGQLFCPACEAPHFPEVYAPNKCTRLTSEQIVCPVCDHSA